MPRKSMSITGSARSANWTRPGSPQSTRSVACCLRSHAVEARLDPHFQVLDATATQTVLYELVDEQLRERLAESDEAVIDLVVKFGLAGLREMVGRLLEERQQIDWEYWRGQTPGQLLARWEDFLAE